MIPADARCAVHARSRALDVCSRCGAFVCAECVGSRFGTVLCAGCLQRASDPGEEVLPGIVILALAGAFVGFAFPPLAWTSYLLSRIALRRGAGDRTRRYASIAREVSAVSSLASVPLVLIALLLLR